MNFKKITMYSAGLVFALSTMAYAAPNGSYKLTVKTKNPWPISVKVSNDKFSMTNNGYVKVLAPSTTSGASATKITGKTKFTTKVCNLPSEVKVTLQFTKDGKYKSGKASGKCNRDAGSVKFSGRVVN